jgi:hypothetical protein
VAKSKLNKKQDEADFRSDFVKSSVITTEELELLRINARDNVLGRFAQRLKDINQVDPNTANQIIDQYSKNHQDATFKSIQDIINYVTDYFIYYDCIKTQEELLAEFERAKKFVFFEGIDLPIVVEFDYQYFTEEAIFRKPTFYSYYNPKTKTAFGLGAYHIAFPSTQKYLTDDEVMVAMKHEFGHIFQGHCTIRPKDDFEIQYNNQAMDISINLGMTPEEQDLLFSVARKIWKNPKACPCMSLAKPIDNGGFGISVAVSATDWRGTSGFIRAYYDKKNKNQQQGKGQPQQGSGQGSGSGESSDQPQIDEKINVGDYIWVPGSNPKIYGKVTAINDQTNDISYDEYTEDEWAQIKENLKNN